MSKRSVVFGLFVLWVITMACSWITPASTPAPADNPTPNVATIVAATLNAMMSTVEPTAAPATATSTEATAPTATLEAVPRTLLIAYARGGNIFLWREGASPRPLTTTGLDQSPRISQDGQWVAFLRNGELYAIRADGSGERVLVNRAYLNSFSSAGPFEVRIRKFAFLPDGREIFFSLYAETEGYPGLFGDLHRVNVEGGAPSLVLAAGQGEGEWKFSPDGRLFALAQGDRIRVLNRDGSGDRVVFTFPSVATYSEWTYYPQVVWRADSSGFYTIIPASAALENPSEPSRYYYVPLTGGSPTQQAEFVTVPVWESFAELSPNGLSVAYIYPESSSLRSLHVIDPSGTDRRIQTDSQLTILNWNPNSRHVVIYNPNASDVYLQAFGEGPVPINDTSGYIAEMRWVTERRFLFLSGEELRLRDLSSDASMVIDSGVTGYDFTLVP